MSKEIKEPQIKITANTYFNCSELRADIVEGQTVNLPKKIGEDYIRAGLVVKANQNAKLGYGDPKDALKKIKDAKADADKATEAYRKVIDKRQKETMADDKKRIANNLKLIKSGQNTSGKSLSGSALPV